MNVAWRKINAQSAALKQQITRMCCNLPDLAQLQRPGCRVSTNAQDAEDCHVAVAPRNDNNFLSRHCEARSNLTILAPEQDCHAAVAARNDV